MAFGHAFHEALVKNGVVRRAHGVSAMFENDLELAGRIFRDQRAGRQAHLLRAIEDVIQEGREVLEVLHQIGLMMRGCETVGRGGRLETPGGGAIAIHQIEFEFDGDDRFDAKLFESIDNMRKRMSRIGRPR